MKRILSTVGLLGGLYWIIIPFFPPECVPVTEASEVLCNRLWSPALACMLLGFIGFFLATRPSLTSTVAISIIALLVGFALMFLGNFVEYWMLSDQPHQGPDGFVRGLAWMTVLFGLLVAQVASVSVGFFGFKSGQLPRWLSVLFLMLLPATLVSGFISLQLVGIPIGIVSIAVGLSGFWQNSFRVSRTSVA